jgi:hypothetical protein
MSLTAIYSLSVEQTQENTQRFRTSQLLAFYSVPFLKSDTNKQPQMLHTNHIQVSVQHQWEAASSVQSWSPKSAESYQSAAAEAREHHMIGPWTIHLLIWLEYDWFTK